MHGRHRHEHERPLPRRRGEPYRPGVTVPLRGGERLRLGDSCSRDPGPSTGGRLQRRGPCGHSTPPGARPTICSTVPGFAASRWKRPRTRSASSGAGVHPIGPRARRRGRARSAAPPVDRFRWIRPRGRRRLRREPPPIATRVIPARRADRRYRRPQRHRRRSLARGSSVRAARRRPRCGSGASWRGYRLLQAFLEGAGLTVADVGRRPGALLRASADASQQMAGGLIELLPCVAP